MQNGTLSIVPATTSFRLSERARQRLDQLAERLGTGRSEAIEQAVGVYLACIEAAIPVLTVPPSELPPAGSSAHKTA